ncbi:MAG TPA: hypothetical protein VHE30_13005, partial [Polyangiaceae bacterium]|nr:hypothetical protein [Polyangiaceae bacterium]
APPSSGYLANSVNGHEYTVTNLDDLQYACVSPLPAPKDCTQLRTLDPRPLCECDTTNPAYADNPSCQNPDGTYGNSMLFAKAYPGLRHAGLVKALGDRAALASICARTTTDSSSPDFAYVPAMDLVLRELGVPH